MKLITLVGLILGGVLGWFAAGEVAARITHPLLAPAAALGLGLMIGVAVHTLFVRRR
jgi:hypothetical protein